MIALLSLLATLAYASHKTSHSVFLDAASGKLVIKPRASTSKDFQDGEVAFGQFRNEIFTTGWSFLEVYTNPAYNDSTAAQAAGMYEGYATAPLIEQFAYNSGLYGFQPTTALAEFLQTNDAYMATNIAQAATLPAGDPQRIYWHHVNLILTQLSGVYQGYQDARHGNGNVTETMLLFINLSGDMEDLANVFGVDNPLADIFFRKGHCSALLRLLPHNSDVYIAQATWSSLNSMLRVYKMYDFPYTLDGTSNERVPAQRSSFSSYPGSLFSGDDFYVLSSGLVVQETTIGYSNQDLNQYIVPQSVLEWTRNILANRISANGTQWTQVYSQQNSGTYNNQNMILDYNLFKPGKPLVNGTFWLCEQIPGTIRSNDLSQYLQENGYFGSYNAAFDPVIRNLSGADLEAQQMGPWFTYNATARALIFKRASNEINSFEDMEQIMRYNNFQHDPLSSQIPDCEYIHMTNCTPAYSAENAIACRDDLNPANGVYAFASLGFRNHVATDAKISSFSSYDPVGLYCRAQSGPTYDQQPVFQFSKSPFASLPHEGMPDRWEFPWVDVQWQ